MFVLREYIAGALLVLMAAAPLAALLLVAASTGYLFRAVYRFMEGRRSKRHASGAQGGGRGAVGKSALAALLLVLLPVALRTQQAPPSAASTPVPDAQYTINVNVHEVLLHATVRNRAGAPVAGLGQDAFRVFEDGVEQSIRHFSHQDLPVTVGIVIDNSGSMLPRRNEVVAAALAFAGSSNPQDQMFLVNFNEHVSLGLPSNLPFTDQQEQLRAAMRTVTADGKTALYDAVVVALEHLKLGDRDKKVLIVVSDGADNASSHTRAQMLDLAAHSNAIVYGVGIYEYGDPDNRNPRQVLQQLAKASGGEAFFPEALEEVRPICERIARDIRNQYSISYVPSNQKQDGTRRAIRVQTTKWGGTVITRTGYVAPLPPPPAAEPPVHPPANPPAQPPAKKD